MRFSGTLRLIGIALIAVVATVVAIPSGPNLDVSAGALRIARTFDLQLGLDLQGGVQLIYEADLSTITSDRYDEAVDGLKEVLDRRVNSLGVAEPSIQTVRDGGDYRLLVELPGVEDVDQAVQSIGETPLLEFYEFSDVALPANDSEDSIQEPEVTDDGSQSFLGISEAHAQEEPSVDEVMSSGEVASEPVVGGIEDLLQPTELNGSHVQDAEVVFDPTTNEPSVLIQFNSEGEDLFAQITERNVGQPVAILLDGVVISAPVVQQRISGGEAQITGDFTIDEARDLANRLRTGALPVPINLISQRTVGATLGEASFEESLVAGVIGLLAVLVFMIVYYRLPGIVAVFALGLYGVLFVALVKAVPVVLTLAGIAGLILSVGLAVDANVLIFERMREELRNGKSVRFAIADGFSHAWSSIRDSNVSTLLICLILFWFGSGIVRGFAVMLGLGVVLSLFSSVVVTRALLGLVSGKWFDGRKSLFIPKRWLS